MAKKPAPKKPNAKRDLKKDRHGLSILKSVGLFKGDVRGNKVGWRARALLNRYADVVEGTAKAVKVGKPKDTKKYPDQMRPHNGVVVVRKRKGETFRYDKKTEQIISKRHDYDRDITTVISLKHVPEDTPLDKRFPDLMSRDTKKYNFYYTVPFNNYSKSPQYQKFSDLLDFMIEYETKTNRRTGVVKPNWLRADWMDAVEIQKVPKSKKQIEHEDKAA